MSYTADKTPSSCRPPIELKRKKKLTIKTNIFFFNLPWFDTEIAAAPCLIANSASSTKYIFKNFLKRKFKIKNRFNVYSLDNFDFPKKNKI